MRLIIYADGGSRGNPGIAAGGAAVFSADGHLLAERGAFIGIATNNVAEYTGLLLGINAALELAAEAGETLELEVRMDSKLVVSQMAGEWKIKHPDMLALALEARDLLAGASVKWTWIPREENSVADALANRAMDERGEVSTRLAPRSSVTGALTVEFGNLGPSSIRAPELVTEPATTLYLVRHGRTALTEARKISGSGGSDPELSAEGRVDAELAARALARIGSSGQWGHLPRPDLLLTSPMVRTRETAQAIGAGLGLDPQAAPDFTEINFGSWEDLSNEEVAERFPEELANWRGSLDFAPAGGETLREFDLRVMTGLASVLATNPGRSIVLVSHVMPIRAILRRAAAADWASYWRLQLAPASVSIVRFWGDAASEVNAMNATAHLERL